MNPTKLLTLLAASSLILCFTACKKTTPGNVDDAATTTSLSEDMAVSDNISDDANGAFVNELNVNSDDVVGARSTIVNTPPSNYYCYYSATIADTAVAGHFGTTQDSSKVITLAFDGTTCANNGIIRSGIIKIVLTDSLRKLGSTATMTFLNYYVNGYRREGKIVWTNTRQSPADNPQWTRLDSGKVTSPNSGAYWYITGSRTVEETSPGTFTIQSGTRTVTNSNGASATATVQTPLVAVVGCPFLESGILVLTGPGGNTLSIDFSAGTSDGTLTGTPNNSASCDNIATYSLNGGTAFPFFLVH